MGINQGGFTRFFRADMESRFKNFLRDLDFFKAICRQAQEKLGGCTIEELHFVSDDSEHEYLSFEYRLQGAPQWDWVQGSFSFEDLDLTPMTEKGKEG